MMEKWEELFQNMLETNPKHARTFVDIYFVYLRDTDMVSAKQVISEIAGMLRFRQPEAYKEFEWWFKISHENMLENIEKNQHRAEIIQFKQAGA
jgi:hypothetical protein